MAEFKIDGRMTVRTLKEKFKKEFEGTLRVYNGREKADDSATLAAIRTGDAKGGELVCRASRTVGGFEKEMMEVFGIKVQVASPDDWVLALDGITLANLKNIPKQARKADMESLVAYKRGKDIENQECTTAERVKMKDYIPSLQFLFEEFDMDDFDGSYYTSWGTLAERFDMDEMMEILDDDSEKYVDEMSQEDIYDIVDNISMSLDQGSIRLLKISDGDKVIFETSNDEPYVD